MNTDLAQFRIAFCDESQEALDAMEAQLLQLDAGAVDPATVNTIFRLAHSIKGNAGMLGLSRITALTHTMESLLDQVRGQRRPFTQPVADALLMGVDELRGMVTDLRQGTRSAALSQDALQLQLQALVDALPVAAAPGAVARATPAPVPQDDSGHWLIQFSARPSLLIAGKDPAGLFADLSALGPLQVTADLSALPALGDMDPRVCHVRWTLHLQSNAPRDSIELIFEWAEGDCELSISPLPAPAPQPAEPVMAEVDVASVRVPLAKIDAVQATLARVGQAEASLQTWLDALSGPAADGLRLGLDEMHLHLRQLHEDVRRLRMLPVGTLFGRFPRLVRDAAAALGKRIRLTTGGEQTELDRSLLEHLGDPLLHLVRNGIDHGIEPPAQRQAAGKDPEGHVHIEVAASAGLVVIEVSDDGRGLDRGRILDKARAHGLVGATDSLTPQQIDELIFKPGLSTVDVATDLSGRGVGMDVVCCNVRALGGSIELHSEPGKGTRFTLCFPIAVDGQIMGAPVADGLLQWRYGA